jgi:ankyrin repeat protein
MRCSTIISKHEWARHVDMIKVLKDIGGDVSSTTDDGKTPMHLAAAEGHVETIKALIEAGGNVSAKKFNGATPRHQTAS